MARVRSFSSHVLVSQLSDGVFLSESGDRNQQMSPGGRQAGEFNAVLEVK